MPPSSSIGTRTPRLHFSGVVIRAPHLAGREVRGQSPGTTREGSRPYASSPMSGGDGRNRPEVWTGLECGGAEAGLTDRHFYESPYVVNRCNRRAFRSAALWGFRGTGRGPGDCPIVAGHQLFAGGALPPLPSPAQNSGAVCPCPLAHAGASPPGEGVPQEGPDAPRQKGELAL
jgi:hypothetical protein